MIPVRLKLHGFLSYQEIVEIDFSSITQACISGSNGAGKSSLIDAITWALFENARKTDESIIHSVSDEAEVIFDFRYEDSLYRVQRIKRRNGKTGEVNLFFRSGDDETWRSLTEKNTKETNLRILKILHMDYDTFTNASFFLQGKADQFATRNAADRKKVLSNILGLDSWEVYKERAARRRKEIDQRIALLDGMSAQYKTELDQEAQLKERHHELQKVLEEVERNRETQQERLDKASKHHQAIADQEKLFNVLAAQRQDSSDQVAAVREILAGYQRQKAQVESTLLNEEEINKRYRELLEVRGEMQRLNGLSSRFYHLEQQKQVPTAKIAAETARLQAEIKALQEKKVRLEPLCGKLADQQAEKERLAGEIALLSNEMSGLSSAQEQLRAIQKEQADLQSANRLLRTSMREYEEHRTQLQGITEAACPLCGQELTPEHRQEVIADITRKGKALAEEFHSNEKRLDGLLIEEEAAKKEIGQINSLELKLQVKQKQYVQAETWLEQFSDEINHWNRTDREHLVNLEAAAKHDRYAESERSLLRSLDEQIAELGYDINLHDRARAEEALLSGAEKDREELVGAAAALKGINQALQEHSTHLARVEEEYEKTTRTVEEAKKRLEDAKTELEDLGTIKAALEDVKTRENRLRMEVGSAHQRVEVLETLRTRLKENSIERESLAVRVGQYKELEKAFGKDGVPALLIEQALPALESTANDILDRLSGGQMSVRFITQKDYKDKNREDKKETLEISINDTQGSRPYEMFSGGEAFRVNFAIRLALSRVLAQRSGARLQTLVIDEGFGSQDNEGRQRLVEAINQVKTDFEKILVITHLEELKDAFPQRIEVEKTADGSRARVV